MAFLALFTGTLFWLVVFFCLMASAYVLFRDGFGYKGALEAAVFLGLMVVVGLPLHMAARRLSGRAMAASEGAECRRWGALDVAATPTTGSGPAVGRGCPTVFPHGPTGLSSALGFTSLFNPTWDASCPCCSPSQRAPGRGCCGRLFSRGGRSWRIRPSYKIFVPSFAPVRNNLRLSEAEPRVDVDADHAGAARHGAAVVMAVLVEGLASRVSWGRVAGVLAWARGARVRVGGPPSCALRTGFDRLRANGFTERACGGVAGGCFGNGFIAGLAQFSYKSKNLFAERKQPPLMLAEPPLTIDADYATNDQTGAPDGMGTRAVLVAVSDCVFHGERVAGVLAWALGARVRVGGG